MLDPSGRYTAAFDPAGRVSRVENPGDQTLTYLYDAAGQRRNLLDADGGRFTYGFDQVGRNTLVVNPQGERTTLLYDAAGRKIASYLANGAHASLTYDPAGRNTEVRNVSSLDATLSRFNYTFDDAGNKTQVVEAAGGVVTWSYDDTYQLTRERRSGANSYDTTYTYDTVGNRLLKIDGGARTTYAYDLANQLQTSIDSSGTTTFTHDEAGNRTAKQSPSALATYQWNGDGRLVQVSAPGVAVTYVYNADRQRVGIDDGSQQQGLVYDAAKLLAEYDTAEGSTTAQYTDTLEDTYGDLVSQHRPDEQLTGGETSYHAFDGLGSTDALLNPSEAATDTWQYKAFGEILHRTGSSVNPFTFVGKFGYYTNPEIDLYYLNDRYYSPVEGRFISIDFLGFDAEDDNLYRYSQNRPQYAIDPSGFRCIPRITNGKFGAFKKTASGKDLAFGYAMTSVLPLGIHGVIMTADTVVISKPKDGVAIRAFATVTINWTCGMQGGQCLAMLVAITSLKSEEPIPFPLPRRGRFKRPREGTVVLFGQPGKRGFGVPNVSPPLPDVSAHVPRSPFEAWASINDLKVGAWGRMLSVSAKMSSQGQTPKWPKGPGGKDAENFQNRVVNIMVECGGPNQLAQIDGMDDLLC